MENVSKQEKIEKGKQFSRNLQAIMADRGIEQKLLVEKLNVSKATVSMYVSGGTIVPEKKQEEIAALFELPLSWFHASKASTDFIDPLDPYEDSASRLRVEIAAKKLGMRPQNVRLALQQNRVPWGFAVETGEGRHIYHISAKGLTQYLGNSTFDLQIQELYGFLPLILTSLKVLQNDSPPNVAS